MFPVDWIGVICHIWLLLSVSACFLYIYKDLFYTETQFDPESVLTEKDGTVTSLGSVCVCVVFFHFI